METCYRYYSRGARLKPGEILATPFDAVVFNEDLATRRPRLPDYAIENRALSLLIRRLADSPETILDALVEEMLTLFKVHSRGHRPSHHD